jgi:hypothetical protein
VHLILHLPGAGSPSQVALDEPVTAGGSRADDVHLPGCPPAALRLLPCGAGAVVEAGAAGVRVGGHAVPAGARRLLRPGERADLRGASLALASPAAPVEATRVAAAALLRDGGAGAAAAGLHLVVLTGPAAGARTALGGEQTVGRGRAASIVLPDPAASRVHARLRVGTDGATVEDLGSKNGVRVNGVRIDRRPFPVRVGDELVVGDTALALADGAEAPVAAAPAGVRRRFPARLVAAALLALSAAALALAAG